MKDLAEIRREIDEIDSSLVDLIVRRMRIAEEVAAAKQRQGVAVSDPERERAILNRLEAASGPREASAVRRVYETLFAESKRRQCELFKGDSDLSVAVIGRGLIGGSFEKACRVSGYEVTILHHGDETGFEKAGLILVCLPPEAVVPWIRAHAARFRPGAIAVDIAGVKKPILHEMAAVKRSDWLFVGGHPMAGREVSGYENSVADLFVGASMILVPEAETPKASIEILRKFFLSLGFGRVVLSSAEHHDRMIAFTSQLCHVIATAYSRSPLVPETPGYSAGSYADMTRIATQDPVIWADLFSANDKELLGAIDGLVARLGEFRMALADGNREKMREIIRAGAEAKRNGG